MEFAVVPYSKISVRSFLEHESPEKFAALIGAGTAPSVLATGVMRWANGVLFSAINFQPSDSVSKEYVSGHLLFDHLDFALMPEFKPEITVPERPLLKISVIDLSKHSLYGPFANWIKQNLAKKSAG